MSSGAPNPAVPPPPEVGHAVMLDGLPSGPEGARVGRRDGDMLVLVGRNVARHAGQEVSLLYVSGVTPARVQVRLVGPADSGEGQVRAAMTDRPRSVERRRAVRVPIRVIARLRGGSDASPIASVTDNASAWGALVRCREALPAGGEYRLELTVGDELVETVGRVVRCDQVGEDEHRRWRIAFAFPEAVWSVNAEGRHEDDGAGAAHGR